MVKVSKIFSGLKKTCLSVLKREERDEDNETDLRERGGTEMSTTVLHSRSFAFDLDLPAPKLF